MRVRKTKKFCTKHGAAVLIGPNQTLAVKRGRGRLLPTLQTLKKVRIKSKIRSNVMAGIASGNKRVLP